ncbi:MAG: ATP12 family protein [Emcibacteraceae bacterium]|nr:ATP12 family protein [Emcibacteraceae bacterium]MDG1859007.1 ATP12 family protein [Emcibacteraceae bacterium]
MKRFYKKVSVAEQDGMYTVHLDGKPIKTPIKSPCLMPNKNMAEAVAKEWDEQEEDVDPHSMPITKLVNTAIDRVGKRRDDLIDELVEFAGSDQICYRAEHPTELVDLQDENWNPLLDYINENHDISFEITSGILFVEQSASILSKYRKIVENIESFELTAYYGMTTVAGSVTIGLALFEGKISIDDAWNAGLLDENFQISKWGSDEEAEKRREGLRAELDNAAKFLSLCR